jgi:hypothetical protein
MLAVVVDMGPVRDLPTVQMLVMYHGQKVVEGLECLLALAAAILVLVVLVRVLDGLILRIQ